ERHDQNKNDGAPDFVSEDAIKFVAESLAGRRKLRGRGHLNRTDAKIAALDGRAAPVHAGSVEALPRFSDSSLNRLGIMLEAGSGGFFVAENQQCLGGCGGPPLVESCG